MTFVHFTACDTALPTPIKYHALPKCKLGIDLKNITGTDFEHQGRSYSIYITCKLHSTLMLISAKFEGVPIEQGHSLPNSAQSMVIKCTNGKRIYNMQANIIMHVHTYTRYTYIRIKYAMYIHVHILCNSMFVKGQVYVFKKRCPNLLFKFLKCQFLSLFDKVFCSFFLILKCKIEDLLDKGGQILTVGVKTLQFMFKKFRTSPTLCIDSLQWPAALHL